MTRIIAGRWGGRRLRVPAKGARPTSDRVREAIFSHLDHQIADWSAVRVLDLYAGSGALGLEALSRGAYDVTFVDQSPTSVGVIKDNVRALAADAQVVRGDAVTFCRRAGSVPFDLVFADPPYDLGPAPVSTALAALLEHQSISVDAVVVVEQSKRSAAPFPEGFVLDRFKDYGNTRIWYGRRGTNSDPTEQE